MDEIENINRLGAKDKDKAPRPILIRFKNADPKKRLFKRLGNLKDAVEDVHKNISIDHDQTLRQRDEFKQMMDLAKEKEEAQDSDSPFLYRSVRGPPWRRVVRKIKKQMPLKE